MKCPTCGRDYEVVSDAPDLLKLKADRLPDPCCERMPGKRVAMWNVAGK